MYWTCTLRRHLLKSTKTHPESLQTTSTRIIRELNLICTFQTPPERLLGQFGKSPIDSNYVGHAGVKQHFIKICKMQIPHQEEACLTSKSIFIARSSSVCLDLAYLEYSGVIFSFWWQETRSSASATSSFSPLLFSSSWDWKNLYSHHVLVNNWAEPGCSFRFFRR